jgi:hypothetical protein
VNIPFVGAPVTNLPIAPTAVAPDATATATGRTAGSLSSPNGDGIPKTIADFLALQAANYDNVSVSAPATEIPYVYAQAPLVNIPQEMFGKDIRKLTGESLIQRQDLLAQIEAEEKAAIDQANRYRSGELQVQRSGIADMIEVATTPEDFARIKAAGKIPVAARDAQVIIENAKREADALLRAGEQGVYTASTDRRQQLGGQIAAGIGAGLTSALTRTNAGAQELSTIRQQAEMARQNLLRNIDQRRSSQVDAEKLNSKAQIDAMIARLEPMQAISQIIQTDAMDTFSRQIQAERDATAKADAARLRREQILLQEPQFKASLAALAATAYTPLPGQFIEPNAASLRASQGNDRLKGINSVILARVKNATGSIQAHLEALDKTGTWIADNEQTLAAVDTFIAQVEQVVNEALELKGAGGLMQEGEFAIQQLINTKDALIRARNQGENSWGIIRNAEDQILEDFRDPQSSLRQGLEAISKTDILLDGNRSAATQTPASAPTQLDFKAKGF